MGGPALRDRAFFFFTYQGTRQINGLGTTRTGILPMFTEDRSAATLGAQFCPASHLNSQGQSSQGYQNNNSRRGTSGMRRLEHKPCGPAVLNTKLPNGKFAVPEPQKALPAAVLLILLTCSPWAFRPIIRPRTLTRINIRLTSTRRCPAPMPCRERFFFSTLRTQLPFSPNGANVPGWGTNAKGRNTLFVVANTQTFSTDLVNVARLGFTRCDGLAKAQNPDHGATNWHRRSCRRARFRHEHALAHCGRLHDRRWRHTRAVVRDKQLCGAGYACLHEGPQSHALRRGSKAP